MPARKSMGSELNQAKNAFCATTNKIVGVDCLSLWIPHCITMSPICWTWRYRVYLVFALMYFNLALGKLFVIFLVFPLRMSIVNCILQRYKFLFFFSFLRRFTGVFSLRLKGFGSVEELVRFGGLRDGAHAICMRDTRKPLGGRSGMLEFGS